MCMSDRDREVVREAARERIRPVEEAGKMLEWDWGSERLAVAESCLPSRVRGSEAASGTGALGGGVGVCGCPRRLALRTGPSTPHVRVM